MNDPEIKRSMEAMALGEQAVGRSMPTQYVYLKEKQDREWKAMVAHNNRNLGTFNIHEENWHRIYPFGPR